jgi:HSP20 family protein
MALARWDRWKDFMTLKEAMDKLFEESFVRTSRVLAPATAPADVWESDGEVVIQVALPGVDPAKLDVSVASDTVTIKGEIPEEPEQWRTYHLCEIRRGWFSRSFRLPVDVDPDKAKAEYHNGILKLTIPKAEGLRPRQVKVVTA